MKKILTCIAAAMLLLPVCAFGEKLVYPFRYAPHEGLVNRTERQWRDEICLNGYWDFQPVALPESYRYGSGVAPELSEPAPDRWTDVKIRIPSPWNANSFVYRDLEGPDHRDFPSYPKEWESARMAWMRKSVTIPADWQDKVIKLHFEAVAGYSEVYVNGRKACENFDLFLPFSTDITEMVQPGQTAEILIGVRSQSLFEDNSTVGRRIIPAGSMWGTHINGIWQDVFLEAVPKVSIEDIYIRPLVSKGLLEMDVTVANACGKKVDAVLKGVVKEWLNLAGKGVNEAPVPSWDLGKEALDVPATAVSIAAGGKEKVTISIPVNQGELRFWTPETPNLYSLLLSLKAKKETIDLKYERFGWREWTLDGTRQYLNGKPYELHGDSWHFMGIPQMTRRYAWAWFTAIKGMNGNAVRPHAQVYPRFYLDVADEMGICVLDETANWGSDAGPKFDSPEFWENSREHLRRLILRDRNHASIFGWSISNENKPVILDVDGRPDLIPLQEQAWADWRDIVRENDSTRPWISSDGEDDGNGILPVTVGHYGDDESMKRWIAIGKPWGIGEHGMGYYGTPEQASQYNGERAYESQQGRMEAIANETYRLISAQRSHGASYSTVFNMVWYSLKPLPLGHKDLTKAPSMEDGVFFGEYVEGLPGVQPERLGPYCTTLNPGYDPSLPLFDPWPMYDAMRAVNAPGGPAWTPWAEIDRSIYDPLPAEPAEPYKEVVFAGESGAFKKALDIQGVIFADKVTVPAEAIYVVDASTVIPAGTVKKIAADMAAGAELLLWGLTPETLECYSALLPEQLEMDELHRATYLPEQVSWTRGLGNSDFYFCALQHSDVSKYTLKGRFVENGTVLLNACRTEWRSWNWRGEDSKIASVLRSENECTKALPVFVKNGGVYINTLMNFADSEKGFKTLATILRNAGIRCKAVEIDADSFFFLREGELYFPTKARESLVDGSLELYVFSPRHLDDLLIEPDMPKLTLHVRCGGCRLKINGNDVKAAYDNGGDTIFRELPLKQGWNRLEINGPEQDDPVTGSFRCENKPEFLPSVKASLTNPE
ncbi:MAG: glycoside hydrolase family 2 [Bacteroidales bacterium]|nr:glycoside hydrolase family 2 [Candidatus Cryptobacteroides onthequi]